MSIGTAEHCFAGLATTRTKALWLTDDENVEHGYVVADVSHKLEQQVRAQAGPRGI
jgi:hypothetical protein